MLTLSKAIAKLDEIYVFDGEKLATALDKVRLLNDFQEGHLKCSICRETVTKDNFGAFKPGSIEVVCKKLSCYCEALTRSYEKTQ